MSSKKKAGQGQDAGGGDGRFFTTTKKGETHELRTELSSPIPEKKTDALKKVRASPPHPPREEVRARASLTPRPAPLVVSLFFIYVLASVVFPPRTPILTNDLFVFY